MGFWPFARQKRDATASLIETLERINLERIKAAAEADAKREELALRKLEIEAQYAEHLAKARTIEAEAKQERAKQRREWGSEGQKRRKENAAAARPACPVCDDEHNIHLTAADIQWHHMGHPPNFTPNFSM